MADGLAALVVPTSTSEFRAMVNEARGHHHAMHGQAADIAAALKRVLPDVIAERGGTRRGMMGADGKIAAMRILRPITDAAALNDTIARLYVTAGIRYERYVVNITDRRQSRIRFDADA